MTEKTRERFEVLAEAMKANAPDAVIGHMAISVAVRAFGFTSSMELARYIVEFQKESLDYSIALLDPNSPESLEDAEIQKMMDDIDLDTGALGVVHG